MKPNDILQQVLTLLQSKELNADIYERFPGQPTEKPITNSTVLLDIDSGEEDETVVSISVFTPAASGASACRALVDQIRQILWEEQLTGYQSMAEKTTLYDAPLRAYRKEATALFQTELVSVPLVFGEDTIIARAGTKLISKRRVVDYFSPTVGDRVQNLNQYARQVSGTAYITAAQFSRLYALLENGAQYQVTIAGVTFTGVLSELSGNGVANDPASFVIQEVPA